MAPSRSERGQRGPARARDPRRSALRHRRARSRRDSRSGVALAHRRDRRLAAVGRRVRDVQGLVAQRPRRLRDGSRMLGAEARADHACPLRVCALPRRGRRPEGCRGVCRCPRVSGAGRRDALRPCLPDPSCRVARAVGRHADRGHRGGEARGRRRCDAGGAPRARARALAVAEPIRTSKRDRHARRRGDGRESRRERCEREVPRATRARSRSAPRRRHERRAHAAGGRSSDGAVLARAVQQVAGARA
jgi:hypothetical protein